MNISTAINIFIKAVNRTHSIPFALSTLNSILVKGNGYEDQTYSVKINKKLYVSYNKNYTGAVTNWASSQPSGNWTYLIVSKYGANRLTDVTWNNATFTNAYLPTKTEMEAIIENLWEDSLSRQWKIFSDGTNTSSSWDYYWTATADDAEDTKAYCASVTTNSDVTGTYAGVVTSTKNKTETLKAIGVSYIK